MKAQKKSPHMTIRIVSLLVVLVVVFASGYAAAMLSIATNANAGLVKALNSVGQNLFGRDIFGAEFMPTDPCIGFICQNGVQIDLAADADFPTTLNIVAGDVLAPVEPCRVIAQLRLGGEEGLVLYVDSAFDDTIGLVEFLEPEAFADIVPSLARCQVGVTVND